MKTLYLIRGIAGSGKTTLANIIREAKAGSEMFAADDFFYDDSGRYNFDTSKLKDAHQQCRQNCRDAMGAGVNTIIVHNTFTRHWEMQPYYQLAAEHKYTVFQVICQNHFANEHGVPAEIIRQQSQRFEF